jgi:hypothetical protein
LHQKGCMSVEIAKYFMKNHDYCCMISHGVTYYRPYLPLVRRFA